MAQQNPFEGLTTAQLQSLQSKYLAALEALAVNQAYSLNGRSLTRANLPEVRDTLGMINSALAVAQGTTARVTRVNFTGFGSQW